MDFQGFRRPRANFYRLPNDWFEIWRQARTSLGRTRILGALKVTEYVIKWSWGYQNFDRPIRLSWLDFQRGRKEGSKRLDLGTGLSSRSLQDALKLAVKLNLLEKHEADDGQPTYLPHLRSPEEDEVGFLSGGDDVSRHGFTTPTANYFLIPASWTDLTAELRTETLLLTMSYFFRHTWGWHGNQHEPCWLNEEEIANGRRYASQERRNQRYDGGTGYTTRAVRKALKVGLQRGWLVWRNHQGQRVHALHMAGMTVGATGEFLGWEQARNARTENHDNDSPELPDQPQITHPPQQEEKSDSDFASLQTYIDQAIRQAMADLLEATPTTTTTNATLDQSTAGLERSKAVMEQSTVAVERSTVSPEQSAARAGTQYSEPSYKEDTDTFSDTSPKTPAADSVSDALTEPGVAPVPRPEDGAAVFEALPLALQEKLNRLQFRGQTPRKELAAAYAETPERIERWVDHLAKTRGSDPQAAGFLLQIVVRDRAPAPAQALIEKPHYTCPVCQGAGNIAILAKEDDLQHGLQIPCPRCSTSSTPPTTRSPNHHVLTPPSPYPPPTSCPPPASCPPRQPLSS